MTNWIKCSDRLPPKTNQRDEEDKQYLGYDGFINRVIYNSHTDYEPWRDSSGFARKITHWAKLPEPPMTDNEQLFYDKCLECCCEGLIKI